MTIDNLQSEGRRRFDAFAARKEREARDAALEPLVTEIESRDDRVDAIGNEWSRRLFDGEFYLSRPAGPQAAEEAVPSTSLVFVESLEGNTGAADPSALGGGETDKHLIYEGLSRVAADAVVAGAGTIRGGDVIFSIWRDEMRQLRASLGKPRHPIQVIATLRGLDLDQMIFNVPDLRVIVLTISSWAAVMRPALEARPWITSIVMRDQRDLGNAFGRLRRLGIERVSAVGGRTIATALIDAGLVDDVYITRSAARGGEPGTPMYPRPLDGGIVVQKRGSGRESGVTFRHIRLRRGPTPGAN